MHGARAAVQCGLHRDWIRPSLVQFRLQVQLRRIDRDNVKLKCGLHLAPAQIFGNIGEGSIAAHVAFRPTALSPRTTRVDEDCPQQCAALIQSKQYPYLRIGSMNAR